MKIFDIISEMDKSQKGPPGWNISDDEPSGKEHYVKAAKTKDVAKNALKSLNKEMGKAHKKVKESHFSRPDAYERDVQASQSGMGRGHDHRGLSQELAHETNNIAIAINGKTWKVIPGKGYADSNEEWKYLQHMKDWAAKKSASSGKKWSVHLTGASITESATAGATSAANVAIGPVYKNKPAKAAKNKDGTVKNAQDMDNNLLTGGSIKR